jgi:hypothetical protein
MARMSMPIGVNFKPVRYVVKGNQIRSDVHFAGRVGIYHHVILQSKHYVVDDSQYGLCNQSDTRE